MRCPGREGRMLGSVAIRSVEIKDSPPAACPADSLHYPESPQCSFTRSDCDSDLGQKMGYIGCLLDILHGATVTANCDCNTLVSQGVADMIAVNGSCSHFVQQVCNTLHTPYETHWFNRSRSRTVWTSTQGEGGGGGARCEHSRTVDH